MSVSVVASPRNHQDPTAVSGRGGGFAFLGIGENLSRSTDKYNVGIAGFRSPMDLFSLLPAHGLHPVRRSGRHRKATLEMTQLRT